MKVCTRCKTQKSLASFYPSKTGVAGRHPWCKKCFKAKRDEDKQAEYDLILEALTIMEERDEKITTA